MAEFRERKQGAHTAGTCLWCGQKLREQVAMRDTSIRGDPSDTYPSGKFGSYSDGFFCGLRCGYLYGVSAAKATGHKPHETTPRR